MLSIIIKALGHVFSSDLRGILFKSIAAALVLAVVGWLMLVQALTGVQFVDMPWLDTLLHALLAISFFIGFGVALPAMTSLLAGLFLDDVAECVERKDFPGRPEGQAVPLGLSLVLSVKFTLLVIGVNILMLPLIFIPGVNIVAYSTANAYLLGREYFSLAAMRYVSEEEAKALRRKHRGDVWLYGLAIVGLLAIPFLNLTAPLFGTALMVHLHQAVNPQMKG